MKEFKRKSDNRDPELVRARKALAKARKDLKHTAESVELDLMFRVAKGQPTAAAELELFRSQIKAAKAEIERQSHSEIPADVLKAAELAKILVQDLETRTQQLALENAQRIRDIALNNETF